MKTEHFSIDDPAAQRDEVARAAEIVRDGGLLAIPTETVYGLGANALDGQAVRRVFQAKGRPQDNPLIIHVPSADWLSRYCVDVPETAYHLAERFWPGPLTMILRRDPIVPDETTGGLDTVGVRCPRHPVTLAIISAADVPIAAPSANTSGRPSCTTAADVREDMDGKIEGIVDGGPCQVGVESTIVDLTVTPPQLLRPGGLPLEDLQAVLGEIKVDKAVTGLLGPGEKPRAPGMKYRHYAPKAPVTVVTGRPWRSAAYLINAVRPGDGVIVFEEYRDLFPGCVVESLGFSDDKAEQARRVFDALRAFDATGVGEIYAQCPDEGGLGLAVANRLKKAAGFHVVDGDRAAAMPVIGITGGTGAGKTTALGELEKLGARMIDCDEVYHTLLRTSAAMRGEIRARFGDVFDADGALDRHKLGNVVWNDQKALADLSVMTHTYVRRETDRRLAEAGAAHCPAAGVDAIALFESDIYRRCDHLVYVTAPKEDRIARIVRRENISEEYARARVEAQKPDEFFRQRCGHVLLNDGTEAEFAKKSARLFRELLGLDG